jgi:farnesyl-diphosphate farnesyltransferase
MPEVRGNTRSAWAIPFLLAVGTIRELQANPAAVIEDGGVKVSRGEVRALRARFAGDSDPDIGDLRRRIRQAPLDKQ